VHAHPDDESINHGATMARYVSEGAQVTLVTCTRGEQGEVVVPALADLAGDALGDYRVGELATAMAALGVSDHRFLGDPHVLGRSAGAALAAVGTVYADSGMAYDQDGGVIPAPDSPPRAFTAAGVEEPATLLAVLIVQLRPQVLVGYEPGGGYGHPDHVQAHLVTMRAADLAAGAGWAVPKVYWAASPDQQVTTAVDATAFTAAKASALRAHATQLAVSPDGTFFAHSNGRREPIEGLELYRLVRGTPDGPRDDAGRETDLLAGT
jgi:N-acetyl-1-D-myo-inositol-2-amino-2-deoxy-alpha-D-glucopyranoside deacetylase